MAAPTLTARQRRNAIGGLKERQKIIRKVLTNPYKTSWPKLEKDDEQQILQTLKQEFEPLNLGKTSITVSYPEGTHNRREKNVFKSKFRAEHWNKNKDTRCHLVLGINAVTRAVEKDLLCAVLVSGNVTPALMTQHLVGLCSSRKIPGICIADLGKTLSEILNFKSCSALGFKKEVSLTDNVFHSVYEVIQQFALPLPDPMVQFERVLEFKKSKFVEEDVVAANLKQKERFEKSVDLNRFYIYKDVKIQKPVQTTVDDFLSFESERPEKEPEVNYELANVVQLQSSRKRRKH